MLRRMWHPNRANLQIVSAALLLALGMSTPVASQSGATAEVKDRFSLPPTDDGLPGAGPIRRYEWFQQLWRERRSAWAKRVDKDQGAVVFLGDSITQGWGGGLGAAFPGVKVANRASAATPLAAS